MSDKKSCEELIDECWMHERERIKKALSDEGDGLYNLGLSFSWQPPRGEAYDEGGYFQFLLSWGGPSDEINFYEGRRIVYVYKDWFDVAERDVSSDQVAKDLRDMFEAMDSLDFDKYRDEERFALLGGG